jgi:hypothetical protein
MCLCGDTACSSCGPAQGAPPAEAIRCIICGRFTTRGVCARAACDEELARRNRAEDDAMAAAYRDEEAAINRELGLKLGATREEQREAIRRMA